MTTLHHDRATTSARRRPRSLDIAVATALTVGLLGGAATAAHAEDSSTGSPAPSSGVVAPVEHPGIDGHFTGALDTEDGRPVTVGTYITWTAELANTGDVEIRTIHGVDFVLTPGEPTTDFSWRKQVTQADLEAGTATISVPYDATTASGLAFTSPAITGTLALPVEHPGLTGRFTGEVDVEDGEPIVPGTYITWTAELTNTGDVEIRTIHGVDFVLTPGETTANFSWRKQITQADLDAGTATISFPYEATTASGLSFTSPAVTGTLALPPLPAAN